MTLSKKKKKRDGGKREEKHRRGVMWASCPPKQKLCSAWSGQHLASSALLPAGAFISAAAMRNLPAFWRGGSRGFGQAGVTTVEHSQQLISFVP